MNPNIQLNFEACLSVPLTAISIFQAWLIHNIVCCKLYEKHTGILARKTWFKYFRQLIGSIIHWLITGLQLSLEILSPLLNTPGVIFAIFKEDGKLDFSTESLKFEGMKSTNITSFSLTIFAGISVPWHALNFKFSLVVSSFYLSLEKKRTIFCADCILLL